MSSCGKTAAEGLKKPDLIAAPCIRWTTTVTSANPDPRQPFTTLMEENPDTTERERFELLVDAEGRT
jgi:hypothetical protein